MASLPDFPWEAVNYRFGLSIAAETLSSLLRGCQVTTDELSEHMGTQGSTKAIRAEWIVLRDGQYHGIGTNAAKEGRIA
jgi:hypothetical protein